MVAPVATVQTDVPLLLKRLKSKLEPSPIRLMPPAAVRNISPSAVVVIVGLVAVPAIPSVPDPCVGVLVPVMA